MEFQDLGLINIQLGFYYIWVSLDQLKCILQNF